MKTTSVLSAAALCLLASACADTIPLEPSTANLSTHRSSAATLADSGEAGSVSASLDAINEYLASARINMRVAKAEIMFAATGYQAATSTIVFANDRVRGTGAAWVKGDPRRGGRTGVNYAVGSSTGGLPITYTPGVGLHYVSAQQTDAQVEEAMSAWRGRSCSGAAIERVSGGQNPDVFDDLLRGSFPADWMNPADVVQGMWQPQGWFRTLAQFFGMPPAAGDNIIGVTLSIYHTDENGEFTDIDNNGLFDMGLAEIYYNQFVGITPQGQLVGYLWSNNAQPGYTDFFSIIAHETGHALGLNHFGKVFVTGPALEDGQITLDEVKYAPKALMNAVYVTGRNEITGTDNSSFCQIWSSRRK
jgi:hypothetical protein